MAWRTATNNMLTEGKKKGPEDAMFSWLRDIRERHRNLRALLQILSARKKERKRKERQEERKRRRACVSVSAPRRDRDPRGQRHYFSIKHDCVFSKNALGR